MTNRFSRKRGNILRRVCQNARKNLSKHIQDRETINACFLLFNVWFKSMKDTLLVLMAIGEKTIQRRTELLKHI